jgi:hypothetical protein
MCHEALTFYSHTDRNGSTVSKQSRRIILCSKLIVDVHDAIDCPGEKTNLTAKCPEYTISIHDTTQRASLRDFSPAVNTVSKKPDSVVGKKDRRLIKNGKTRVADEDELSRRNRRLENVRKLNEGIEDLRRRVEAIKVKVDKPVTVLGVRS